MIANIYSFLKYIDENSSIPTAIDLNFTEEELENIVRKCKNEKLTENVSVDILENIYSDNPSNAITIQSYEFLEKHNPLNKISN